MSINLKMNNIASFLQKMRLIKIKKQM